MQLRDRSLGDLNAYQIAGLAFFVSTVAAVGTLLVLRRTLLREKPESSAILNTPTHFSEDLTIPGFTASGETIAEDDARQGHSPEGV